MLWFCLGFGLGAVFGAVLTIVILLFSAPLQSRNETYGEAVDPAFHPVKPESWRNPKVSDPDGTS